MKKIGILSIALLLLASCSQSRRFSVSKMECNRKEAPVGVDSDIVFSWQISSIDRDFLQKGYTLIVSDNIEDVLHGDGNMWEVDCDSDNSIFVPYEGKPLESSTKYYWRVKVVNTKNHTSVWSKISTFTTGILSPEDWNGAEWIAMEPTKPDNVIVPGVHGSHDDMLGGRKTPNYKIPIFRKNIAVEKKVDMAIAYVSGLGQFELFLNGQKAGDNFLDPAWSLYSKEVYYVSFDVTDLLQQGNNGVAMMVGNGFYNIPHERYHKMITSFGSPRVLMNLAVKYTDGSRENFVTDASWKSAVSPITYSSIYGGEDYDATLEQKGWKSAAFDDSQWQSAIAVPQTAALIAQTISPMRIMEKVPTVRITKNSEGNYLYDLGQNFSGIVSLKVRGQKGQSVKLWCAELLNDDNTVNQSASGGPQYYQYTLNGEGVEQWHPQFTYYGQRYIELEGGVPSGEDNPKNLPVVEEIKGLHTRNSTPFKGNFTCSDPLFNKTFTLIDWAIKSNIAHVMTDCPHREKLGWMEQTYLMGPSIRYNYDLAELYSKGVHDMCASQRDNGLVADIAPEYVVFEGGFVDSPEWGSAVVILPWLQYEWYGDSRPMAKSYDNMKRYVDYLGTKSDGYLLNHGLGDWLDLGPNHPGFAQLTSVGLTATATYYYDVVIMSKVAKHLNKSDDAQKYEALAAQIKEAYNKKYFNPSTKTYDTNSQTASAMSLSLGLVEEEYREDIVNNLVADIRGRGNAVTAGDVGYTYVIKTLMKEQLPEVVIDMNSRYDVPGYGYQLAQGATALTESWQAARSISHNHLCLGHILEWFYGGLCGISQADGDIGFRNIVIAPQIPDDISYASASYESPYGEIKSSWKQADNKFSLNVRVPANTFATIKVPTPDGKTVYERGIPLSETRSVFIETNYNGLTTVKVGSGEYSFTVE